MTSKINKMNDKSLEQSILIILRDNYIDNFIEEIIKPECKIIPLEYITENIRLDYLQKNMDTKIDSNFIINDKLKREFLTKLFKKYCKKKTAKMISEL